MFILHVESSATKTYSCGYINKSRENVCVYVCVYIYIYTPLVFQKLV